MENNLEEMICINPVESYEAPQIPTFGEAHNNPVLLKKLPSRWQKNAKVIAGIGLMGSMMFSGYTYSFAQNTVVYNSGYSNHTGEIVVLLNGTPIAFDVAPIIIDDSTMVPFRAIFEALGMEVDWNPDTRTAIGIGENIRIELPLDSRIAFVNAEPVELDVPAQLRNNITLVPMRFVAENSGAIVEWEPTTRTVVITTHDRDVGHNNNEYASYSDFGLESSIHQGGSGMPFYVVHLTEQESLNIIRSLLEAAGLDFSTDPPDYTFAGIEIDLFDKERGVAFAQTIGPSEWATNGFAELTDIPVMVFEIPREARVAMTNPTWWQYWGDLFDDQQQPELPPTDKAATRAEFEARLTTQAQEFITYLQSVGIIQ